jgi:hypothetical protein
MPRALSKWATMAPVEKGSTTATRCAGEVASNSSAELSMWKSTLRSNSSTLAVENIKYKNGGESSVYREQVKLNKNCIYLE